MMKLRVKIGEKAIEVEVGDLSARPVIAVVDGESIEVWPEEEQPNAVAAVQTAARPAPVAAPSAPGAPAAPRPAAASGRAVTAPIPGTILAIAVKEGDSVTPGQELLTLESMKMKSAIRSNRSGVVARILIACGDRINQGQALIEFTD